MELRLESYQNQNLPDYWDPYYTYAIYVGQDRVGTIILREGTVERRYYDGHIGYTIDPPYRGHSYALCATLLVLSIAKQKGFKTLVITCNPDNIASKKTIQKLSATYVETRMVPRKLQKYFDRQDRYKEIYLIHL